MKLEKVVQGSRRLTHNHIERHAPAATVLVKYAHVTYPYTHTHTLYKGNVRGVQNYCFEFCLRQLVGAAKHIRHR